MLEYFITDDLQVAVDTPGSTLVHSQITLGETVEEIAVFISRAVLLKDLPHFRLKKGHVYVNSHHREVPLDGKVLRFDITEVEAVGEVTVEMAHHVQEAEGDVTNSLGLAGIIQWEESLVVRATGGQIFHCVKVTTGSQHR